MVKKYVTGLVVGKFCPLHNGHLSVIKRAFELCEKVIILSYTSEKFPGCESHKREAWLKFAVEDITDNDTRSTIRILDNMAEWNNLGDDAPEDVHRHFCADYLLNVLDTTVQAVFTSEDYGSEFADYLSKFFSDNLWSGPAVDHIMVDKARNIWPISGTQAREDLAGSKRSLMLNNFLPWYVRKDFVRKVLFLGAESTGKTTLVKALGDDKHTVLEFGRYLFDKRGGKLQYEDMAYIGKSQIIVEDYRAQGLNLSLNDYLYCDTSPLTTAFYSQEMFGCVSRELWDLVWNTKDSYYKIFLCAPDFPMVQDGTRKDEAFRQRGHTYYLDELDGFEYTLLTGSLEERIAVVKKELS